MMSVDARQSLWIIGHRPLSSIELYLEHLSPSYKLYLKSAACISYFHVSFGCHAVETYAHVDDDASVYLVQVASVGALLASNAAEGITGLQPLITAV